MATKVKEAPASEPTIDEILKAHAVGQTTVVKADRDVEKGDVVKQSPPMSGFDPSLTEKALQELGNASDAVAKAVVDALSVPTVLLELPLADKPEAYAGRHLEIQMAADEATVFRRLFDGLDKTGARLSNGRRVASRPDAFRWIMQQLLKETNATGSPG